MRARCEQGLLVVEKIAGEAGHRYPLMENPDDSKIPE